MRKFWFGKIAVMILIFFAIVSGLVMMLWNWLMPELFGLTTITYWQAAGLLLLSKIIFGFKKGHGPGHHHGPPWKRWQHKWHKMPEEQREKWKQKFADKWCGHGPYEETSPAAKKEKDTGPEQQPT